MNHVLTLLGWNIVLSVPLAVLAWRLCRIRPVRVRPALCHAIWLLVLLKLVTPPLIPVPVLPAVAPLTEATPVFLEPHPNTTGEAPPDVRRSSADATPVVDLVTTADPPLTDGERLNSVSGASLISWRQVIFGFLALSGLITLGIWLAAVRQLHRVRRLLRAGASNTGHGFRLLDEVRRRFEFSNPPKLYVVEAAISPMLWAERGGPTVILPQQLANELDDDQLRHVFAHELAHYARRDHWTNVFGFLVTTLFWWHPVAWFARHELNLAAELCCDALALTRLSGSRKSYARTLLAVVDSVDCNKMRQPVLAVTFGGQSALRRRFQMLAEFDVKSSLPWAGWCLLLVGAVTLLLLPIRVQGSPPRTEPPQRAAIGLGSEEDRETEARAGNSEGSPSVVPETELTAEQKSANAARDEKAEAESIANAKEIGLALHFYHSTNGSFPPAAGYDKDGKPLLSWRVHILPFMVGQESLYRQFKPDEPWDSEHNRKLISQMPKFYVDPAQALPVRDGSTTYVAPVGENTIFAAKDGTSMSKITDGTSNTVMVVNLAPDSAVVWTKPDDWSFLAEDPGKGLVDGNRKQFLAIFADASVHPISAKIDAADLRRLMQKDDREPLSQQY